MTKSLKVADIAWLSTALLHRANPSRFDFERSEILERARQEFGDPLQPGVAQHIVSHGVANKKPSPATLRLFTQTGRGRRRLFREGDPAHPKRTGKIHPNPQDLPETYRFLVDWYVENFNRTSEGSRAQRKTDLNTDVGNSDPKAFLAFVGLIPAYDLKLMEEAIERDCERIEESDGDEFNVA